MSHCCVIGGAGFIGEHLVRLLNNGERLLTVVGRNPLPTRELPEGVRYVAGDCGDSYFLKGILQDVDEVIILAHTTVPQTSFEGPVQDILDNLPGAVKLFEASSVLGIKKLVFVSSGGTVYGNPLYLPISEGHPTNPISPYGITKLAIEKYAFMFHKIKKLPVICVRPANAYGTGQIPFTGQGFIATAMAAVLRGEEIDLYGENGTIRDYIHVTDVATGIAALLERGRVGECYNIGSGVGMSNRDVLQFIAPLATAAGLEVKVRVAAQRGYDVPANVLDCGKIKSETGWSETVAMDMGIRQTWEWISKGCKWGR